LAGAVTQRLLAESEEFAELWASHEVGLMHTEEKHFVHSEVGELDLNCQTLLDVDQDQILLVFTATPGSRSAERLQLLSVIGNQKLSSAVEK
jgi:hypothetical protein